MNHSKKILFGTLFLVFVLFSIKNANAMLVPNLLLSTTNNNTQVQLTVYGADPSSNVLLYYPTASSYVSANVGTTNVSGYLTAIISPSTYNVSIGSPVYVMVDGAQSMTVPWPNYTASTATNSSGTLTLSQTNLSLTTGQSSAITVSSSNGSSIGTVTVPSNTSLSVASASVSGNQITVTGFNAGSASMTICASNLGCGTLYVSVQPASSIQNTSSSNISFSQSSVTLGVGQSQAVTLSGPGNYYVSANSNIGIVSTSINGSSLILGGVSAGTVAVSVCSSGNNTTSCGTVNVTVTSTNTVSNSSNVPAMLIFTPSEADMTVGQSVTVNISSPNSGVFYVSTNSNSDSVTANINVNSAILTGVSVGGANINICQQGYGCGNLYGYVAPTAGGPNSVSASTATSANANPPALASFSVTSNNVNNNFTGSGVALTFSFQFNQGVINPQVKVNGNQALVNGSGNGPYQSIYTMTGSEASPLPISITFANANGATGQAYFTVGGLSSVQSTSAVTTVCPSGMTCTPSSLTAVNGFYSFTRYLYMGMTKLGVSDPDVLALQNRLKSDGIYSGPITGYFGSQTKTAVETYQKKNDLSPLGVIGPGTRNLLNKGI